MRHTLRDQDTTLIPVTVYHNPGCSKSRQALELLRNRDVEPQVAEHPILMERPIAVTPERAAPGRPPGNVFDVL